MSWFRTARVIMAGISGRAGLLAAILLAASCSSTRMLEGGAFQITTSYMNFKPRTVFAMRDGKIAGEIALYDKQGQLKLRHQVPGEIDAWKLNYSREADSLKADRDILKLNAGLSDFTKHMSINYRPLFEKGESDVTFTILLWLNEKGRAEHSVCIRNVGCPPEVIKSVVDEAEAWQFPQQKGTRMICFQKTFVFHVMHHTDFVY